MRTIRMWGLLAALLALLSGVAHAISGANVVLVQNGQVLLNFTNAEVSNTVIVHNATAGSVTYSNAGTTGQPLLAAAPPAFGALNLSDTANTTAAALPTSRGGTGVTTAADDTVLLGNGTIWVADAIPNCPDTGTNHLNYTAASNDLFCGTAGTSGFPIQLAVGTNGDITAGSTVFAWGGHTDSSSREAAVQMPVNSTARVWNNLRCKASGVPGGTGLTVTFRKGACGSQANTGLNCAIGAAATVCTGEPVASAQSVASAGDCIDVSFVHTAGNTIQVICSLEQTA